MLLIPEARRRRRRISCFTEKFLRKIEKSGLRIFDKKKHWELPLLLVFSGVLQSDRAQNPKIDEKVKNRDFSKVENTYQGPKIWYPIHNLGCLKQF